MNLKSIKPRRSIRSATNSGSKEINKPNNGFSMFKLLGENFVDFCNVTSLHGCQFIFDEDETTSSTRKIWRILNAIFWITVVLLGAIFAVFLMFLIWSRFQNLPTVTTIETNNYPIWRVPFPAVTICNVNPIYKPSVDRIGKELINKGFEEEVVNEFFRSLTVLITFRSAPNQYLRLFSTLETMGYTTEKLMYEISQPCNQLLRNCMWMGKTLPCDQLFNTIKSGEGFCCAFNYKPFSKNSTEVEEGTRVSGSGEDVGLRLLINVEEYNYTSAMKMFYGADILIHDTEDYPQIQFSTIAAEPEKEIAIAITPSIVAADDSLRTLPLRKRNCLFDDEKQLKTSNKYSFQACMTECRADTILQRCDCVPYFYPEIYDNSTRMIRQCTLHDAECLRDSKYILSALKPPTDIRDYFNKSLDGMVCECYPSCTERTYDSQAYTAKRETSAIGHSSFPGVDMKNLTLVKVYFRDLFCIKYRRDIYLTWDGVLANFGGLFGLCLGGSVISLMEIVYFSTVKMYKKIRFARAQEDVRMINVTNREFIINSSVLMASNKFDCPNYENAIKSQRNF